MLRRLKDSLRVRVLAVLAVLGFAPALAQATMATDLPTSPFTVLQVSALISAGQVTTAQFTIPVAGTVTVSLRDLEWPERLAALSFCLTDGHDTLARLTQPGSFTFELDQPGSFFGFVAGTPRHSSGLGLYSLQVSIVPVPLPAAGLLLATGLAGLALARRRRTTGRPVFSM